MAFIVNDSVQVRLGNNTNWFAGTVTAVNDKTYTVTLTTPTALTVLFGSNPSKYAADQNISVVNINKSTEFVGDPQIRVPI